MGLSLMLYTRLGFYEARPNRGSLTLNLPSTVGGPDTLQDAL